MTIKLTKRSEKNALLHLEGRLDTSSAPSAQDVFLKVASEYAEIELDFTNLDYISSAGLRCILMLQKQVNRTGGTLSLSNVSSAVGEVFEITGFSSILTIK